MSTLTIFANFYINDEERFLRMQDSFRSFKDIKAEKWVINVRGKFKLETLSFLQKHLGDKLIAHSLESKKGWFYDTRQMLKDINTDFVLFWLEDHINMVNVSKYDEILIEMYEDKADYLSYSWWCFGKQQEIYSSIEKKGYNNIQTFTLDKFVNEQVIEKYDHFLISMPSICSVALFKKIILGTLSFLRVYSKYLPFGFEKGSAETQWLPFRYALSKYELFASIDDEQGCEGYSLQSRGLYPTRNKECYSTILQKPARRDSKIGSFVKKILPNFLIKPLSKTNIFIRRVFRYINLLSKGL